MARKGSQTRGLRKLVKKDVLVEYADPLGTLLAATVLAFLAGLGVVTGEALAGVALAVLAALTGVELRQRYLLEQAKKSLDAVPGSLAGVKTTLESSLGETGKQFQEALGGVERMIDAVASNDPYEILEHEAAWSIERPDGSLAYGEKRKRLRFNQNNVVSIYELSGTSGGRNPEIGDWRFEPESIKNVGEVMIGGDDHILLSLGKRYQRNQELDYKSTRTIRNLFVDEKNHVSQRVREETHDLSLKVVWPAGSPPKRVRVDEVLPDGTSKDQEIKGADLPIVDGRPRLECQYPRPPLGQRVVITWWL